MLIKLPNLRLHFLNASGDSIRLVPSAFHNHKFSNVNLALGVSRELKKFFCLRARKGHSPLYN